jgi:5-methylcytosine-specific restriction endonuclease McrA
MKTCKACGLTKEDGEFNKGRSTCKACQREYNRAYRAAHTEEIKEQHRAYRERNTDKVRASSRAYYKRNTDKVRAKNREWANSHREQKLRTVRQWRRDHPEQYRQIQKRWRRDHPESERELAQVNAANRAAKRHGLPGRITIDQWRAIKQHYSPDGTCPACGGDGGLVSVDHVVPFSKGGQNEPGNIQAICDSCNHHKSAKTIDYRPDRGEFARSLVQA